MGIVYLAYDYALDRKVGLKLVRPDVSAEERAERQSRLLLEAQALARLSHPNVTTVHDVRSFGDQVFIALELVRGGTLRDWLRASARPWRDELDAFLQAGRRLPYSPR